jgi:ABC-2 type transport system ATP-binding protein
MKQRLGVAAALPACCCSTSRSTAWTPEGIRWIRDLMRGLAAEGRTVLVSSHLMSEMALTADRVVVIGKGKLILESSMRDLADRFKRDVLVRTPDPAGLARALNTEPTREGDALIVQGLDAPGIAEVAARHGIAIHELTPRSATLEDACLELTEDSLEHRSAR